jgi:hypothetical protein
MALLRMVQKVTLTTALESNLYLHIKSRLLSEWQGRWNRGEMSRFTFSISPCVQLYPLFLGLGADRTFIAVVSRLMSNHTRIKSHLNRIKIVVVAVCCCGEDYETVEQILWSCSLYQAERMQLKTQLSGKNLSLCAQNIFHTLC